MNAFAKKFSAWMSGYPEVLPLGILGLALIVWLGLGAKRRNAWLKSLKTRITAAHFNKAARWQNRHLVQIVSWLALPALIVEFVQSKDPTHRLILFGLILIVAVLVQFGRDLLPRLKKVGPVEFVERRVEQLVPRLEKLDHRYQLELEESRGTSEGQSREDSSGALSELAYEYEKADLFISSCEWSGLANDGALRSNKLLHSLLLKVSAIALIRKHWVRAADRLELLLKITDGKFKPAEVHYRCGIAFQSWARESLAENRERLFLKAHSHLNKAVQKDPRNRWAYFNLAYVQFDLKMFTLAQQNNEAAIKIRPDFAAAKVNLAICYSALGDQAKALESLQSIRWQDENAEKEVAAALKDRELRALFDDEKKGRQAQSFLEDFSQQSS